MDQFSNDSTFEITVFINSMLGVRVRCIENAFFSPYHYEGSCIMGIHLWSMDVWQGLVNRTMIKVDLRYTIIRGNLILHVNTNEIKKIDYYFWMKKWYLFYCKIRKYFTKQYSSFGVRDHCIQRYNETHFLLTGRYSKSK